MTTVTIEVEGWEEISRLWAKAPAITVDELSKAAFESTLYLQREIQERTPVGATSSLRLSIAARRPLVLGETVIGEVGTSIAHALPVELGTKPHMPPIAPLVDWVEAKLGESGAEARSVAFAIARKIARQGTKGKAMFATVFKTRAPQVQAIFAAAVRRIKDRLSEA